MCSVQLIFSILRHTFISKASNLVMSFLIVLIYAQYKVTLKISVFTILFLRHLHSSQSSPWYSFLLEKAFFLLLSGATRRGGWGPRHQDLGRGSEREGRGGS